MLKTFFLTIFSLLLFTLLIPSVVSAVDCSLTPQALCSSLNCPPGCEQKQIPPFTAITQQCSCVSSLSLPNSSGGYKITSPVGFTNIGEVLSKLLPYVFVIAGLALFIIMVLKGFEFLTSGGDPKKTESAKEGLTAALVGFLIIFVSYWVLQILEVIFHIKVL